METRNDLINKAVLDCLNMLYKYSVPSMSFDDLQNQVLDKKEYDTEYFMHHYIPEDLYDEILDRFQTVYGIEPTWQMHCDIISEYLFEGGRKDIYVKDTNGIGHRDTEPTKPLSELIGEEAANKVKELFEYCKNYYRFDRAVDSFKYSVGNFAPTINKKSVEDYWKEQGKMYSYNDEEIKKRYYKEEYGEDE